MWLLSSIKGFPCHKFFGKPIIYTAHVHGALRLRHGHSSQCLFLYQLCHSTFQKRSRSGSPCYFTKDTCMRLLRLKIMACVVAAIHVNLPTSFAMTCSESKKISFSHITSVNGNTVNSQYVFYRHLHTLHVPICAFIVVICTF